MGFPSWPRSSVLFFWMAYNLFYYPVPRIPCSELKVSWLSLSKNTPEVRIAFRLLEHRMFLWVLLYFFFIKQVET